MQPALGSSMRSGSVPSLPLLSVLVALMLLPALVPEIFPSIREQFLYPYLAVLEMLCIPFCLLLARLRTGVTRLQWRVMAVHFGLAAIMYVIACAEDLHLIAGNPSWSGSLFSTAARMATLLAVTASAGEGSRPIRALDACMAFMLPVLQLIGSYSATYASYAPHHLYVWFASNVFVALVATAAYIASGSRSSGSFSYVMLMFLWYRVLDDFLVNIVNYEWLSKPREFPFNLLFGVAPLLFCWLANRARQVPAEPVVGSRRPWLQSLIPSLLALAGVMLAPLALREHALSSAIFVTLLVALYMARTNLLYRRLLHKQTELRTHARRLEHLAARDALTGIGNRRSLEDAATGLLGRQPVPSAALILVDTDHFKLINDAFGHSAGDDVLCFIADVLCEAAGAVEGFCCARLGGDEFVALLPGVDAHAAKRVADRVRRHVNEQYVRKDVRLSISVGFAVSAGEWTLADLLKDADEALYRAKSQGRNRVAGAVVPHAGTMMPIN